MLVGGDYKLACSLLEVSSCLGAVLVPGVQTHPTEVVFTLTKHNRTSQGERRV